VAVFAQVVVDTVIRFPPPTFLFASYFVPELNKLYMHTANRQIKVMECSTYQEVAEIPHPSISGFARYAWNWRRQKLYFHNLHWPLAPSLAIDAVADTIVESLPLRSGGLAYASEFDLLFCSSLDTLLAYDCAADTIVRRILSPLEGYNLAVRGWDSVGRKLYVSMADWSGPLLLAVYDYESGQFTKLIDVSSVTASMSPLTFCYVHHKAYFGPGAPVPYNGYAGVIDTERDSLLRVFRIRIGNGQFNPIAIDYQDDKVYIAGSTDDPSLPESLWVVDCATDSVLKKVEYARRGWGACWVKWIPWSNRLYIDCDMDSCLVILDCNTDSVIVPRLHLGYWGGSDVQPDPIRQRTFVVGAESATVHVLRDVGYGVAEPPTAGPALASGLRVQMTSGGYDVRYSVPSPCRVDLSVYDLTGREVRQLVAEEQPAGQHRVVWNGRDRNGAAVARGVYFVRLDSPGLNDVKKAVVAR
jgi:hypothetical protein